MTYNTPTTTGPQIPSPTVQLLTASIAWSIGSVRTITSSEPKINKIEIQRTVAVIRARLGDVWTTAHRSVAVQHPSFVSSIDRFI